MLYNIYFGTIGKTLGVGYKFTRNCKNDEEANSIAYKSACSLYYKNEGNYGLPSFSDILKEAEITGVDMETLYSDHINDMMRWYAIPTDDDSVPVRKLKY